MSEHEAAPDSPRPPTVGGHDRGEVFPALDPEHVRRIRGLAAERTLADGEVLWRQGDCNRPLFVVLEGGITILSDADHVVTVHGPREFSGDVDLLSGRPVVVAGRALGATRVLELPAERLRQLVQTDAELGEVLLRAFLLRRAALMAEGGANVLLIGSRHSAGTLQLQEFLTRNSQPYRYFDVDVQTDVQKTLDAFAVTVDDVPVFVCRGTHVLRRPTLAQVAECLRLDRVDETRLRDLVVIGAGPAGLAAAVYAASEGLDVLVLETSGPGGQAGASSRIENYLGFPTGVSGQELASNAFVQAEKFGAEFAVTRRALRLRCDGRVRRVDLGDDLSVAARSVVVATGVQYRKPDLPDCERFEGTGVYYAATSIERRLCSGEDVVVVGGGNSAGQAAVFLSGQARKVHMLVRGPALSEGMSRYLIRRIEETPNIELGTECVVTGLQGDGRLERVSWREGDGTPRDAPIRHVFLMTGATPNTTWLEGCVALDAKGFVKTGPDLLPEDLAPRAWPLARRPHLLETSLPGVFAAGDVRAGSVKRVAAAVGEGSACVQFVHRVLAE